MNERQRDLAVILGSTSPGRTGAAVAEWAMKKAAGRASARYELIDLADYPLPRVEEPMPPPLGPLRRGAHESLGGQDRRVRRLRVCHARVQAVDLWRAQGRHRLRVHRAEGRRARRLREDRRRAP